VKKKGCGKKGKGVWKRENDLVKKKGKEERCVWKRGKDLVKKKVCGEKRKGYGAEKRHEEEGCELLTHPLKVHVNKTFPPVLFTIFFPLFPIPFPLFLFTIFFPLFPLPFPLFPTPFLLHQIISLSPY